MKRLTTARRRILGAGILICVMAICGCRTPKADAHRTDPDIARAAQAARMAFERGSIAQADRLYERALREARAQDDVRECGTLAYNLAVCRVEQERLDEALTALMEARADYERLGRATGEISLLEAEIARRQGRYDDAKTLLDRVVPEKGKKKVETGLDVMAWLVRARIAVDERDATRATEYLKRAKDGLKKGAEGSELAAQLQRTEALIASAEGRWRDCAAAYDREAEVWRRARQFRRMAAAMGLAAAAYKEAGALPPALEHYYLAARTLAAQGDDVAALKLIESAMDVVEQSPDAGEAKLLVALFKQIKARNRKL